MPQIGAGVLEIRIKDGRNAYRIIYIAKYANAVYVLHCFQKKSTKTNKQDIELAMQRFRGLEKEYRT